METRITAYLNKTVVVGLQCIRDYVPPESDIVFVEFTMNDGQKSCEVTTDGRCAGFSVIAMLQESVSSLSVD